VPVARRSDVRYAWNGDVALAYQVFGAAPVDLHCLQGCVSHVDLNPESPHLARFLQGLGERAQVIHTDRRGWCFEDRGEHDPEGVSDRWHLYREAAG
jgi:hypothetical protein